MWPFKRRSTPKQPSRSARSDLLFPPDHYRIPWSDDITDLAVLKYHTVRVLSGMFMNRHTECRPPHPFCGNFINTSPARLIAQPVNQIGPDGPILAIYTSRATESITPAEGGQITPFDGATSLRRIESVPYRKLVVNPNADGTYTALRGPILNPVEGDYATGSIDPDAARALLCDPEPQHARWEYWESELSDPEFYPEYRCLIVHGQCWVVEADLNQGLCQQVAGLEITDHPEHNFGIHARPHAMYSTNPSDDSEYAKVIRENLPVI